MTAITLRKEIRNILSKYFEDDTLKDACADELLKLRAFGIRGIESAILTGRPVTEDDLEINTARVDMVERVERLLGVTPNMAKPAWETVISGLLKRAAKGQTLERYTEWCKANKYDAPKVAAIATNPHIILDTWAAAFPEQPVQTEAQKEGPVYA